MGVSSMGVVVFPVVNLELSRYTVVKFSKENDILLNVMYNLFKIQKEYN